MTDARQLVPTVQQIIDAALPLAEAAPIDGDFTVTLYVRRRNGEADCDANISIRAPRRRKAA